jgi:hypothetical protein
VSNVLEILLDSCRSKESVTRQVLLFSQSLVSCNTLFILTFSRRIPRVLLLVLVVLFFIYCFHRPCVFMFSCLLHGPLRYGTGFTRLYRLSYLLVKEHQNEERSHFSVQVPAVFADGNLVKRWPGIFSGTLHSCFSFYYFFLLWCLLGLQSMFFPPKLAGTVSL